MEDTRDPDYARRLARRELAWWRRWVDVQHPYRWNLRRLDPGFVLDLGCGIGRNLVALDGVGVDHNPEAVAIARERGCLAFLPEEFAASPHARSGRFDSLLAAHVVEHMSFPEAADLLAAYAPFVRAGGKVILIAPQEAGFRSDPTHVEHMDPTRLTALLEGLGARVERVASFPFPRWVGRIFPHNEWVAVGRV